MTSPKTPASRDYRIQYVRERENMESEPRHTVALKAASGVLVPKLAGYFFFVATATVRGIVFSSLEPGVAGCPKVEVQFPDAKTVAKARNIGRLISNAWAKTLASAKPDGTVKEFGFVIRLNTANGTYFIDPAGFAEEAGKYKPPNEKRPQVSLPDRTPDELNGDSGIYTVATFHTHPPTVFMALASKGRGVGPSTGNPFKQDDAGEIAYIRTPGIVYDYVGIGGHIPARWAKNQRAKLYYYGITDRERRRDTPNVLAPRPLDAL